MVKQTEGQHYLNSPNRVHAIAKDVIGLMCAVRDVDQDDPLLYAYDARDNLKHALTLTYQALVWCDAVITATPDELMESGAR